jgi:hypothetical protein
MKKYFLLIVTCLFIHQAGYAQTNVSGGVYNNTTWTLANSPYIVTDTIVVFPNVVLTIEPGVVVKFDNNVTIEVRQSTLIALGTSSDSITFTSNNASPAAGIWKGIYFNNAASPQLNYCIFKYAHEALKNGSPLNVQNMSFSFNDTCIAANSLVISLKHVSFDNNSICIPSLGYPCFVDSCLFINNGACLNADGQIRVTNCEFDGNVNGVSVPNLYGDHMAVINCTFCNNTTAIHNGNHRNGNTDPFVDSIISCGFNYNHLGFYGGFRYMIGNVFTNNDTAYEGYPDSAFMHDNYIVENGTGILGASGGGPNFYNNFVCNNHTYNIRYTSINNGSFPGLCFCDTDSAAIAATIYDGYDNISLGLLTFMPVAACDSTVLSGIPSVICSTFVTDIQSAVSKAPSGIILFPNPASGDAAIHISGDFNNAMLDVYNIFGERVKQVNHISGQEVIFFRENLSCGLYFLRITENNKPPVVEKLVIADN